MATLQVCSYSFGVFLWQVEGGRISVEAHCLKSTTGTAVQKRQHDEPCQWGAEAQDVPAATVLLFMS